MTHSPDPETLKKAAAGGDPRAVYNLGVWYLGEPGRVADAEAARGCFERAAGSGFAPAQSALGYLYLRGQDQQQDVEGAEADYARARHWFRQAAEGGFAEAQYRLGELCATGLGGEIQAPAARQYFEQAAAAGHPAAGCQLAYCLDHGIGGERDTAAATRAWLEMSEGPPAQLALAWRCETGRGTAKDPVRALAWYLKAAGTGHPVADAAVEHLASELNTRARSAAEKMAQGELEVEVTNDDPGPRPLVTRTLSWAPRAFVVRGFLDPMECAHLISAAMPHLRPSKVLQRGSGEIVSDEGRTSGEMSFMNPLRDVVVHHIEERLSSLAMLPLAHGEPLVMLHYAPGDEYQTHVDYFDPSIPGRQKGLEAGGQRLMTILTYLNQPTAGGETVFPEVDLTVPPRAGTALMFFNTLPNGEIDRLSRHAGAPVRSGEKWLATRWFRELPVDQRPPPKEPQTAAPGGYSASFRI